MFNLGNLTGIEGIYDFTCGKYAQLGDDKFWEAEQAAYAKSVEDEQDRGRIEPLMRERPGWPWETREAKAINHIMYSCSEIRDVYLKAAKNTISKEHRGARNDPAVD